MRNTELRGHAAVSWLKRQRHMYEDRYRLLTKEIPLVIGSGRGGLFAVMDGIGSASMGMAAAQAMVDCLVNFYREPDRYSPDCKGLCNLLHTTNHDIFNWGTMEASDRPLGGCAGTVAWLHDGRISMFHAGDTVGLLIREGMEPLRITRAHEIKGDIYRYFGMGKGHYRHRGGRPDPADV
jgi:PPM family protein phosphatase